MIEQGALNISVFILCFQLMPNFPDTILHMDEDKNMFHSFQGATLFTTDENVKHKRTQN